MSAVFEKLALYWTYPFVRYALAVGVLIALCSSLLGVTLVLLVILLIPSVKKVRDAATKDEDD